MRLPRIETRDITAHGMGGAGVWATEKLALLGGGRTWRLQEETADGRVTIFAQSRRRRLRMWLPSNRWVTRKRI